MERIPNINVEAKRQGRHPILTIVIYIGLFFFILFSAEYVFIRKNILKNVNPITKMQEQYREKKYPNVIQTGKEILEKHPRSLIVRRYLWKSYLYTKQFGDALRTIKEMEGMVVNNIEIYLAYCTTFRILGQYEKMEHYCSKALEIKPNNEIAHEQIIQALIDQKKYNEAADYLNKLSENQPDDLKKILLKANIEALKGHYPRSIEILEKARGSYPKVPIIYYYLGENYFMMGDHVKAASFLEEFTESVYKKDVDVEILEAAYTNLALSYEKARMFSNSYRAYKNAACFSIKMNKTNEAVRLMNKAITATYAGYTGFVSQVDFKRKFKKLEDELEDSCGGKLFTQGGNN